jgi:mono/diheme cytochrome c family protein
MRSRLSLTAAALALAMVTAQAGGWAVVTVDDLPERIVAAENVTLRFSVRRHGMHLLSGLAPRVDFSLGSRTGTVAARPVPEKAGYYSATLSLPEPGNWKVTIFSGFVTANLTLNPVKVVPAAAPAASTPVAQRGEDLFVAKGCASCHYHQAIGATPIARVGADLSAKRYPDAFLAKLLADPSMLPPANGLWKMPNLDLKPQEIAALTAFINQKPATTASTPGRPRTKRASAAATACCGE